MDKEKIISRIRECGLVAVVRAGSGDEALRIAEACMKGGVAAIELTYTVPGITDIISRLAEEYKGSAEFMIGAGTVLDEETARTAMLAGAQYIVSPYLRPEMVKLCNRYRVPVMPGAMTIKEVAEAMECGADIIKIFPGEVFGPKIIKAVNGPLPHARLMPTGGVTVENAYEWIKAGAVAVGAGGSLTGGAKTGDFASITDTAKKFIAEIKRARGE
ncbi:MAG: bifunctional 2-keto-4-hydroxyglutarate aldolase/2-keto-3-deoxy-6-phosphogluconate aldolase [Oscillospiraceae bacterium]